MKVLRIVPALLVVVTALGACTGRQVYDNTVDTAGFAVKTTGKAAVGAGKLVYKGGKYVVAGE